MNKYHDKAKYRIDWIVARCKDLIMEETASKTQQRATVFQLLRFAVVGVIATAIHYGIYLLLLRFLPESIAYTIGYAVSFVCNFILTCLYTFRKKASTRRGVGFGMAHLVNYCLHIAFLNFFLKLGVHETYAPIPVFCIVVPLNFILLSHVFNRK